MPYVGASNGEALVETKHGLSPSLAASGSNRPYDHADALKYATYPTKTPDTFVFGRGCWSLLCLLLGWSPLASSLNAEEPQASNSPSLVKAASADTGTVRGSVIYAADPQHPWRLGRYYIKDAKTGRLAEAVVALSQRGLKADDPQRPAATITVDQKNFQFIPETSAIRAGDHVRFINSDDHTHNVKTSHPKFSFNVTMPVDGEQTETFEFAGGINQPYRIDCVLHSAMRAWIYVFDHPWFHVTTSDGAFEWKNVPAGEYRLEAVHPAGDLRHRQNIQVVAGQTLELTIALRPNTASR